MAQNFRTNVPAPNVNFNPTPQANPLDAIMQGYQTGQTLGLRQRQQDMLEQERAQKKELMEQQAADKAIEYLLNPKYSKFLAKETKTDLYKQHVVPLLNKTYSLGINPDSIEHDGNDTNDDLDNLLNLHKNKADPSIIKNEYLRILSKASEEELPLLREVGKNIQARESTFKRPMNRVSENGNPLFWDSKNESFMEIDPETKESIPYFGKNYPQSQNPSSGAEKELRDVYQQRGLIDEASKYLTDDKIGLIDRQYKNIGAYIDNSTDPDAIYFRSIIELANTVMRNNFYGATLTNNEQKAFSEIAANRNLSMPAFKAQVQAMKISFNKLEDAITSSSERVNRPVRNLKSDQKSDPMDLGL
jgi:hypothetical protein